MNFKEMMQRVVGGFAQGVGWRAANMMPVWVILIILALALIFGVNWN